MKKLAPIIITIVVCAWVAFYTGGMLIAMREETSVFANIMLLSIAMFSVGIFVLMIWTLVIRLKEINKEDKDDISKY